MDNEMSLKLFGANLMIHQFTKFNTDVNGLFEKVYII